jgi:hypothetical protein
VPMTKEQYETAVKLRVAEIAAAWQGALVSPSHLEKMARRQCRYEFVRIAAGKYETYDHEDGGSLLGVIEKSYRLGKKTPEWFPSGVTAATWFGDKTRDEAADRIRRTRERERYEKELVDRFIFITYRAGSQVYDVYDKKAPDGDGLATKIGQVEAKITTPADAPRMATIYNPWLAQDDDDMTMMGATTREEAADWLVRRVGMMPRTDKPPPPKPDKMIGDFFFGSS